MKPLVRRRSEDPAIAALRLELARRDTSTALRTREVCLERLARLRRAVGARSGLAAPEAVARILDGIDLARAEIEHLDLEASL